jgi:hypothetical protein
MLSNFTSHLPAYPSLRCPAPLPPTDNVPATRPSLTSQLTLPSRAARLLKPDSGHADTISITVRARRARRNAMKPRIQCVLTGK